MPLLTLTALAVLTGLLFGILATVVVCGLRSTRVNNAGAGSEQPPKAAIEALHHLRSIAFVLDCTLKVVYENPVARDDLRFKAETLTSPAFRRRAERVLTSGMTDTRELWPDDPERALRIRIARLQHEFVLVYAEDLGEEQRLNTMRRDFMANISHEFKTPISAISLLAEAITEAADDPDLVRNFASSLTQESRRLRELSRDVIQLSEAQSALDPSDLTLVDLEQLARDEVATHRDYAHQQGVELRFIDETDPGAEHRFLGNAAQVHTALANLVGNALRHSTSGGRVDLVLGCTDTEVIINVIDEGEGIEPEHLPRLFERFYRVDPARSRANGGTGLGLSIARHTARSHGGDIDVWSKPGVGSSFSLRLPAANEAGLITPRRSPMRKRPKDRAPILTKSTVEGETFA